MSQLESHMKRSATKTCLSIAFAFGLLAGCGGGDAESPTDTIKITSVTPNAVDEGAATSVTVSFDYQLQTKEAGTVYIGFNTNAESSYILSPVELPVSKGLGTGSLTTSVQAIAYPAPGSFRAYVNLSERPHETTWTPLASDNLVLSVTPRASSSSSTESPRRREMNKNGGSSCSAIDSCAASLAQTQ